ncbi:conjugal transfer protein TrbI [Luteibacter flocculans]|uniref:Conjugal transfer protein TrbI n=1 Tax=Luteibacter flocculans TaxID=2780091 RepID=A0ABY4T0G8_9GAMM|nr:TrbI/VirB10 family protein [Luteibacter flocculans]URL58454.1 conjugal transfer protein TrbI [Luteibacter flocculans]
MERQHSKTSPSDAVLTPRSDEKPTGVRRVNNMPLLIIGGVLAIFVVLVALVAAQRGAKAPAEPAAAAALPENSRLLDQMLANAPKGGLIPDPDENRVPSFPVARVADPDLPPRPDTAPTAPAEIPVDDAMAKQRMSRFQTAMQAKTAVISGTSAQADRAPATDREAPEKPDEPEAEPSGFPPPQRPIVAQGDYGKFDRKKKGGRNEDRWQLDSTVDAPRTVYEVRAGAVIPATLISGINSELPGQIIAQVSQDVFDTATGRYRVVPQGSKLIGRYDNGIVLGQSRVLVAWQRIVFPDGKAMDIGSMEGVDSAGYAGLTDKIDRHYMRLFGSAILMSGITAGLTSSRVDPENDPFGSSSAAQLSQSLAQQIGEVATKMIEKNMNIAPTLRIRPGYRFNVMAVKDLTFEKPYRAFDYR